MCPIPWVDVAVMSAKNSVLPCCKYRQVVGPVDSNLDTTWTNEDYNALRQDLIQGLEHKNCSACDVGPDAFSYKKWKTRSYLKSGILDNVDINKPKPKVLHLAGFSNTCNLACRMCDPGSSSKLQALANTTVLGKYLGTGYNDYKIDLASLSNSLEQVEQLSITGGEPFLDKPVTDFIESLHGHPTLKDIHFSTNMSIMNKRLLDALDRLNVNVSFSVSIDGPKHVHEYIRHGSNYEEMLDNIKYIASNYNFKFNINTTISAYNVGYVTDTIESFSYLSKYCGIVLRDIMFSPVLVPEYLHPGVLPIAIKEQYITKLKSFNVFPYQIRVPSTRRFIATAIELLEQDKTHLYDMFTEYTNDFNSVVKVVPPRGIEPRSDALQAPAMTTSAKAAFDHIETHSSNSLDGYSRS